MTPGPGTSGPGTRDPLQNLKVEPQDTLQNLKVGPHNNISLLLDLFRSRQI